ncbi:hypothetical protein N9115_02090 [bacterium]|nr:hypothetical protein [Akkermansiaceae bacterium]MDB4577436.1 hypothetical protein [bacterium]
MIQLSEKIGALMQDSLLHGVDFVWIDPSEIECPYRDLLFHSKDMTSTLARFHGSEITLSVLQEAHREGVYVREVLLSAGEKPVEYGLIEVTLGHFDEALRSVILSGKKPLGGILNESRMGYQSNPSGYFKIKRCAFSPDFFPSRGGEFLFGRYNILSDANCRLLARIVEILPYENP